MTWWLRSARVKQLVQQAMSTVTKIPSADFADIPAVLKVGPHGNPLEPAVDLTQNSIRIEIPHDINAIVNEDETRARSWRAATRAAFKAALAEHFVVSDFFKAHDLSRPGFYLLTRH